MVDVDVLVASNDYGVTLRVLVSLLVLLVILCYRIQLGRDEERRRRLPLRRRATEDAARLVLSFLDALE